MGIFWEFDVKCLGTWSRWPQGGPAFHRTLPCGVGISLAA